MPREITARLGLELYYAAFLMTPNLSAMSAVRANAAGSILPSGVLGVGAPHTSLLTSVIIHVW